MSDIIAEDDKAPVPEKILNLRPANSRAVTHFRFSPSGEAVATWRRTTHPAFSFTTPTDTDFQLWGVSSGEQRLSLVGKFSAMEFAPDGKTLAIEEGDQVSIRDVTTGDQTASLDHQNVTDIRFQQSGKLLVTATCEEAFPDLNSPPSSIKFWDTATWKEAKTGIDPNLKFRGVPIISPDGQWLAVFVTDRDVPPGNGTLFVKILNIASGLEYTGPKVREVLGYCEMFSGPDPGTLTINDLEFPKAIFWDLNTKTARITRDYLYPEVTMTIWHRLSGPSITEDAVSIELKQKKFVIREWRTDRVIGEVQNPTNWKKPARYRSEFPFKTGSYLASKDLLMLYSAPDTDGEVNIWNRDTRELSDTLKTEHPISAIEMNKDGKTLALNTVGKTADENETRSQVILWDLTTRRQTFTFDYTNGINAISFSPDGSLLAIAEKKDVHLRNAQTGDLIGSFDLETPYTTSLAFSPDSQYLAVGTSNEIQLWHVAHARREWTKPEISSIDCLAFSPDGRTLAVGSGNPNRFSLIDASDGTIIFNSQNDKLVSFTRYSADGRTLSIVRSDGCFSRFDPSSKEETDIAEMGGRDVSAESRTCRFALHESTNTIAAARFEDTYNDREGEIALFDATTGEQTGLLSANTGDISCVQFTPDGRSVIGGGATRRRTKLEIVDLKTGELAGSLYDIMVEAVSPDGEVLVARNMTTGGLLLCGARGGRVLARVSEVSDIQSSGSLRAHFSPDGTMFGTTGDGVVKLWSVEKFLQDE
ncbi:MAG: hypothetical protein JNL58_01875 [Planctomyces sp.]|nr:hypothetical protein [Planctomyces sp.]